ncbi:outer membrane beta-barrel protein [Candidatus Palauibacter sp.]|uniref:outer membrane beta-barrel protein n=1 Tax=Candidatus Palauibacter sp. TaxID=3101350 RepID=UPI003AF30322
MRISPIPIAALIVLTGLTSAASLVGQTTVGIHAGLTRARLADLEALTEQESRSGVRLGVSTTVPVSGSLGLRFAGSYVQAGGGARVPQLEVDYFRLSALARVGLAKESRSGGVYFLVGPYWGLRTACSVSVSGGGASFSADCDARDIQLSATDFGVSGGAGLEVGVTNRMGAALEFLYDLGIQGLGGSIPGLGGSKTTRVFSLLAGLVFSI